MNIKGYLGTAETEGGGAAAGDSGLLVRKARMARVDICKVITSMPCTRQAHRLHEMRFSRMMSCIYNAVWCRRHAMALMGEQGVTLFTGDSQLLPTRHPSVLPEQRQNRTHLCPTVPAPQVLGRKDFIL